MGNASSQDPERHGAHMISTDDAEYPREFRTLGNGGAARRFSNVGLVHTSERRHTVIAAQSLEALSGLPKRDAFLDHLKNKYPPHHSPHHSLPSLPHQGSPQHAQHSPAGGMRGQQDRVREQLQQARSPRHSQSTQSGLADQASKLSFASAESLETMSEADIPIGFNRMNRLRQSLPLSRSTSQTKLRSPGVLFLQFGDETRRVHITHELSSADTLHALIVHMFPQKLTTGMLKSANTAILIKDEARNVFYELEDVRDIQDRSVIKIFRKEPLYASYPGSHLANGDLRREMVYTSRDSSPTRRLNSLSPSPHQGRGGEGSGKEEGRVEEAPPPRPPRRGEGGEDVTPAVVVVVRWEDATGEGETVGVVVVTPSPSAILERRDVKPDEELSGRGVLLKSEGLYADSYGQVHEGRLSIASTQSLAAMGDPFTYPISSGLYRRGSVRSLSTYSAAALQGELEDTLYKPGGPLYPDTYAPSSSIGIGFRVPHSSSSPQKIPDGVQLRDRGDPSSSPYSGSPSRASPVRQSFRKDSASSSVFVESPKSRSGSASDPLVLSGGGGVEAGRRSSSGYGSPLPANGSETRERMEAMEKQIASLTGLVQSVLTRGPDSDSNEKTDSTSEGSGTGTLTPSSCSAMVMPTPPPPPPPRSAAPPQPNSVMRLQMQLHLHGLQQNASNLRDQLSHLRKMQLQNQDSVRTMLKRTETEISVRLTDALRKQEDPLQRQRTLVEEERLKYLNEEELIIQQLHDLEKSVDEIQKDSSVNHRLVTVQELEEKALVLRKLGETLTELKSQFPSLQSKMRVVLRVEVEAVKFLKEEPQRLDALLKRCKNVTDSLTNLRRQVNEGIWKSHEDLANQSPKLMENFGKNSDFHIPTSPPLNFHELGGVGGGGMSSLSSWQSHSASGLGSQNSPAHSQSSQTVPVKNRVLDELGGRRTVDKSVSVEAAERDWEEKRASLTQYSTQDINRLLEETQAELMKAIPDLDFVAKQQKQSGGQGSQGGPVTAVTAQSASGNASPTPEHRPGKPQHPAQKLNTKTEHSVRRGSEVPQPPSLRGGGGAASIPSSHGLTTTRSGDVIVTSKSMKKADSEETESLPKPQVKLRRSVSEAPRPASTPPIIASGVRDEDDEDRIIAELEVFQRAPKPTNTSSAPPSLADPSPRPKPWPLGATVAKAAPGRKRLTSVTLNPGGPTPDWEGHSEFITGVTASHDQEVDPIASQEEEVHVSRPVSDPPLYPVPQIVLTHWVSAPTSPTESRVFELERELPCTIDQSDQLHQQQGAWRPVNATQKGCPDSKAQRRETTAASLESETHTETHMGSEKPGLNSQIPGSLEYLTMLENKSLETLRSMQSFEISQTYDIFEIYETYKTLDGTQGSLGRTEPHNISQEYGLEPQGKASEGQEKPRPLVLRIQESFERGEEEGEEVKESISFLITETRIQALPMSEAWETARELGEEVQTVTAWGKEVGVPHSEEGGQGLSLGAGHLSGVMEERGAGGGESGQSEELGSETVSNSGVEKGSASLGGCSQLRKPVPKPRSALGSQTSQPRDDSSSSAHARIGFPEQQWDALRQVSESRSETAQRTLELALCDRGGDPQTPQDPDSADELDRDRNQDRVADEAQSGGITRDTYRKLDSLEETIRELENSIQEISRHPSAGYLFSREFLGKLGDEEASDGSGSPVLSPGCSDQQGSRSGSEGLPLPTRIKPPLPPKPAALQAGAQQTSGSSSTTRGHSAASRLKHIQQSSPEKSKQSRTREECGRLQGQQQYPEWVSTLHRPQVKAHGFSKAFLEPQQPSSAMSVSFCDGSAVFAPPGLRLLLFSPLLPSPPPPRARPGLCSPASLLRHCSPPASDSGW
ncbi:LOW QUALITY PROTEIN: SRC kinase signaling inhibitor 1-like [Polyodon spathula]|uniref:LOW QUALITY PROTEIN: SRC kinase signaling inhibitor 1-like n=1 Tax=Polyodon spathula TaxID=7913 RepID=UPI001B7F0BAD|nr:LOW QUALITY PROTEIN: SRC kinase signaling inhibitor 1-like [Polyodon spathula]